MRCLALISLPMRRASVCGFLHEANVAVDFSFSSLSLCDIVYWEKKTNTNVNKKVFILFFISKEDTVIRFVIAICHDPPEELPFFLFFSKISKCSSSVFPRILTPEKLCLLFYTFPFFYEVCKMACLCDTCRNSHLHGDVRSPVEVLPEGLSFIQLRKSHWTRASMHPALHAYHHSPLILRVCACECAFL